MTLSRHLLNAQRTRLPMLEKMAPRIGDYILGHGRITKIENRKEIGWWPVYNEEGHFFFLRGEVLMETGISTDFIWSAIDISKELAAFSEDSHE